MKKILIIDGNYFSHRVLGQLNSGDNKNNLETEQEIRQFVDSLHLSLYNIYRMFNNESHTLIDQIIFVSDSGSWRKDIEPYKPYYLENDTETVIGYKEQRVAKKDESPINYDNFYQLYSDFVDEIDKTRAICVIKINKLEGDDLIALISNKFDNLGKDAFGIIFANDGDLDQVVRKNVCIFRNIRSKVAPNGEIVMSLDLYKEIYEKSTVDVLLNSNTLNNSFFKTLTQLTINPDFKVDRKIGAGISISTPFRTVLVKSLAGDKKDNIFSTISWLSKTGTRRYSVTEKIIEKALAKHNYHLIEEVCKKILTNQENLHQLILSVIETTNQDVSPEIVAEHFKHNLKLNLLSRKVIPENLVAEFDKKWEESTNLIFQTEIDVEKLKQPIVVMKKDDNEIFENSLPE